MAVDFLEGGIARRARLAAIRWAKDVMIWREFTAADHRSRQGATDEDPAEKGEELPSIHALFSCLSLIGHYLAFTDRVHAIHGRPLSAALALVQQVAPAIENVPEKEANQPSHIFPRLRI